MLPDELILGIEIRTQVTEYVHAALRSQHLPHKNGNRRIVFPIYIVDNDSHVPLGLGSTNKFSKISEGANEYIIHTKINPLMGESDNSKNLIEELVGFTKTKPFKKQDGTWITVACLTDSQAKSVQNLDTVQSIEKNHLSESDLQAGVKSTYYDPHTSTFLLSPLPIPYDNISVLRANSMKFLPNFFTRH